MNKCTGTFRRSLLTAVTAVCTTGIASLTYAADQAGDRLDSLFDNVTPLVHPGGIAGVSYAENFESGFILGFGCNQSGWTCVAPGDFEIVDFNPPQATFGNFSAQDQANGSGTAVNGEMLSPLFTQETGVTYADIVITDNGSLYQWIPWSQNAGNTANFFNTRINFEANGTITALQIDTNVPPNCGTGTVASFHATTGTWAANVKMRIGVEVTTPAGPNSLKLYKDGALISTGFHDIGQECAPAQAVGISRLRNFNSNTGNTTRMIVDNISSAAVVNPCAFPLPLCRGDVDPLGGNGVVNISDLLKVIATWGQTQVPPGSGPRPQGDCAPLPNGDCLVNITDLLAVIAQWGNCPVVVGACCANGGCIIASQAACTGSPNFGSYQGNGTTCASVVCPVPPPGDLCVAALNAVNGSNAWNNTNANLDGPVIPASCLPAGGGGRGDVWFRYTASCTGHLTLDTIGTQAPFTDTLIQVFDGWTCNPVGGLLGCNDDIDFAANNWLSRMTIQVQQNQQLLVRCMSQSFSPIANSGPAVLNIACVQFNNDLCGDASEISTNVDVAGTLIGTTPETGIPFNCLPGGAPMGTGRWYTVMGTGNTFTATTCSSTPASQFEYDGVLSVYCGTSCSEFTCIGGSATLDCGPGGPGTGFHESVSWCALAGRKYWIYVGGDQIPAPADATYTLRVNTGAVCSAPGQVCGLTPANDLCANAIVINNGTTTFDTTFANTDGTSNSPPPAGIDCSDNVGTQTVKDIWYTYTATCTGSLLITTCSNLGGDSNFDSDLVLYPGNATCPPTSAQIVACNDDDLANPCGAAPPWASTLRATVTNGNTYRLRVGGYNTLTTDFGTGKILISCTPAVCGNGIIEAPEDCDDQNGNPSDGCDNCVATALCSATCTYNSIEACAQVNPDNVNGGCNSTPEAYETVPLAGGTAVICGNLWAGPVGTSNFRDTDWYKVTVGAAGVIQVNLTTTTTLPMTVQLLGTNCALLVPLSPAVNVTQGQCGLAKAIGLPAGSQVIVFVSTASVFTGFPCPGPWNYSVRVVSP